MPLRATAPVAASFSLDEYWKTELLAMVNKLRATGCRCGNQYMPPAPPLQWNEQLEQMALIHTSDMRRHRFMGHYSSTGVGIAGRAKAVGYHYIAVGENVAEGYASTQRVFTGWRKSPGHCRNMMRAGFQEMGAAWMGDYWAQEFGDPVGR